MASSKAWLLQLDDTVAAAVGELEIAHVLQFPKTHTIAGAPAYCQQVTLWQEQVLPVFDLSAWLQNKAAANDTELVAVAAYQQQAGAKPQYGGLRIVDLPRQITVADEQACALPTIAEGWPYVALACFEQAETIVPILDIQALFCGHLPSTHS